MSQSNESVLSQGDASESPLGTLHLDFENESSFLGEPELEDLMASTHTINLQEPVAEEKMPRSSSIQKLQSRLPVASDAGGLHEAAERGDVREVSRLLRQKGIDMNERAGGHRAYRTALHRAAGYGHEDVVRILLKAGADPEKRSSANRTPLHEACTGGHVKAIQELLHYVTDLDCMDNYSHTPAHLAAFNGEADCMKLLISSGCSAAMEDKQGKTPAHLAAMKNHSAVIRLLIEEDVEVSAIDDQGKTPAHCAAASGGLDCLKVLAQNEIDVNCKDHNWCLPIHDAAANDHLSCVKYLIMARLAKQEARDNSGKTPLHMAAQHGATECLHWLLERKANANIRDGLGATPLHYAASGAHLQCVSCLLKHGAELDARTSSWDTPLDYAKKGGNPNAFQRAVDGKVPCKFCVEKKEQIDYDMAHQPTKVERNLTQSETVIYAPPRLRTPGVRSAVQKSDKKRPSSGKSTSAKTKQYGEVTLPPRDLATKYFGEHLFSLPNEIRTRPAHKKNAKPLQKRT